MTHLHAAAAAALLCAHHAAAPARADVIYNEQIQGDFSDDRLHPTPLQLAEGNNSIAGRLNGMNPSTGEIDLDYFSITIPAGHQLSAINLETYLSTDFVAFLAIDPGPVFSIAPEDASIENLYGWLHFGVADIGNDLLDPMSHNGRGFTPPLPAGTYTFWAQQFGEFTEWTPVFVVDPIPAPTSVAVLAALMLLSTKRHQRA